MIIYLNGNYVDDHRASLSIWDAGFLYGEGVFTTLRVDNGGASDLESHWERLRHQAAQLAIPFSIPLPDVQTIIENLVVKNRLEQCSARLRITLTRGIDPDHSLPLLPNTKQVPTLLLTLAALPEGFDEDLARGIKVITLGPDFVRQCRPDLKTLNFLPSLLALRQARIRMCSEAIMIGAEGFITEAAISSVFVFRSSKLMTPKNNGRILPGRTRQIVLDLARKNGLACAEVDLSLKDLTTAPEVFLCNSIRGVVPVISIDDQPVAGQLPGPITKQVRQWYRQVFA